MTHPLTTRQLNRATLERQLLLHRSPLDTSAAVSHLLGLQAQNPDPPYYALAARLEGFDPYGLSRLLEERKAVRIPAMRSTIHLLTAEDTPLLRAFSQPALESELRNFRRRLEGVDIDRAVRITRDMFEEGPRGLHEVSAVLCEEWPDAEPLALKIAVRVRLALVQVPPRGLWGQGGRGTLTTVESWLGEPLDPEPDVAGIVLRYLAAFGPASVRDIQTWAGVTRLREVIDGLRPRLRVFRSPQGAELFDLPDAPRPDPDTPAPPRFLPEFDNVLLSHADRTRVVPEQYWGRTWQGSSAFRTFLVDGFLAGTWRLEKSAPRLVVEPFARLTRAERDAVAAEAADVLELAAPGAGGEVEFAAVSS
jgi:Winged helix DNA-binding domain